MSWLVNLSPLERSRFKLWSGHRIVFLGGTLQVNQCLVCLLTGNPNASIPTPQPVRPRPMFGAFGAAVGANSVVFVSKVC